jgi:threonine/homoserine/homoserine lactone efflux protein
MSSSLAEAVPLALAIAASPLTIVPAILLLFTARPRATATAFLLGWLLGILASTTAAALVAGWIDGWDTAPRWVSWLRVVAGILLIALGVRQWLGRRAPKPTPAWMTAITEASPSSALRLALLLAVANPKVLLLSVAAGLGIGGAELSVPAAVGALVGFAVIASLSVAGPLLAFVVVGDRMLVPLGRARDWLLSHNAAVMAVVLVVIGLVVLVEGASALR